MKLITDKNDPILHETKPKGWDVLTKEDKE